MTGSDGLTPELVSILRRNITNRGSERTQLRRNGELLRRDSDNARRGESQATVRLINSVRVLAWKRRYK
jgi:hypothetical protein